MESRVVEDQMVIMRIMVDGYVEERLTKGSLASPVLISARLWTKRLDGYIHQVAWLK